MTEYNLLNKPGRKKLVLFLCLVFLIGYAFFFLNSAKMDDFTSLITDTTVQYQDNGVLKDYDQTALKDNTPLIFNIKATVPQGVLSSYEDVEKDGETTQELTIKNNALTFSLPEGLKLDNTETNKLYLENDLNTSIGTYEVKDNLLTMYFDEDHVKSDADQELKLSLVLETDSNHLVYDSEGLSKIYFNNKEVDIYKYVEQPTETTVTQQVESNVLGSTEQTPVTNSVDDNNTTTNVLSDDVEVQDDTSESVDFGKYITSSSVSKLENGEWKQSTSFEDGDQVKVRLNYTLPSGVVTSDKKTISYQLPDGVKPLKEETGYVFASNGKQVGTYVIGTDGKINITFNNEFANGDMFSGYIEFEGTVSSSGADDNGKIKIDGDGGEITVVPNKEAYDINVSKKAMLSDDKKKINYTVSVGTTKGTSDTVTVTDRLGKYDSAEGTYDANSFKIIKKDASGNETEVSATLTIDEKSGTFTYDNLPKLNPGESYEISYSVDTEVKNSDGSGSLTNSVKGASGKNSKEARVTTEISKSKISKRGGYDQNTGKINWTITINPEKEDISGYKLKDEIDNGLKLPTPLTVTKSDGTTFEIESLPYTFPDGSNDTYTIEYQTDAPEKDGQVKNTATISKDGKDYSSGSDVWVNHRDWDVSKTSKGKTVEGKTLKNEWEANVTLPEGKLTSVTYSDVIKNGTSKDDTEFSGEHYAILSDLKNEIEDNISLTLSDGTVLKKEDLDIAITFYGDEGKTEKVTDENAHVKAFEVTVKRKDGEEFTGRSLKISQYHTVADISKIKEGIDYTFENTGSVNDKSSTSKVTYNKPKKLVKQGYGKTEFSDQNKYSSSKVTADYKTQNGKLYYRIIYTPESDDDIEFTDTLPEGTTLVQTASRTDQEMLNNPNPSPEVRGSPEVVYYRSDSTQYPFDGKYKINDYFKYEYDEKTRTIKFKLSKGYNNSGNNTAIAIYYAVDITDDYWNNLKNTSKEYVNSFEYDGNKQEQHTEVEREIENVSKSGKQLEETVETDDGKTTTIKTTKVEYSVIINPAANDLNPKSDKLTLTDNLSLDNGMNAYFDLSNTKLYEYDDSKDDHRGKEIDASRYTIQYDEINHKITVTLPDELACVLVYQYDFDVGNKSDPKVKNKVSLEGEYSSDTDTVIDTSSSSAGVVRGKMTIYKVDSKDYSKTLPGAKFKLYQYKDSNWEVIKNGESETFTTNDKGEIVFEGSNVQKFLSKNILYKIEEVEAPEGYKKDPNPHYFVIYDKDKQSAIDKLNKRGVLNTAGVKEADILFAPNNKEVSLYVPNSSNSISVKKVWVDSNNKETTAGANSINVQLYRVTKKAQTCNVTVNVENSHGGNTSTVSLKAAIGKKIKITAYDSNYINVDGLNQYIQMTCDDKTSGQVKVYEKDGIKYLEATTDIVTKDCTIKINLGNYSGWDLWIPVGDLKAVSEENPDVITTETAIGSSVSLNESNNWAHTWTEKDFGEYTSKDDEEFYYMVKEVGTPSGYQVSYTNNDGIKEGDITVTNKKLDNYDLPDSGGFGTLGYYAIGALLITATLFAYIANKKNKGVYNK